MNSYKYYSFTLQDARDVVNAEKRKRRKFIRAEDISSEEQEFIDRAGLLTILRASTLIRK